MELDTKDITYLIKRYWAIILLLPILCAAAGYFASTMVTPLYKTESELYIRPNYDQDIRIDNLRSKLEDEDSLLSVEKSITSREVIIRTLDKIGVIDDHSFFGADQSDFDNYTLADKYELVSNRYSASLVPNSRLIKLISIDSDPERAVRINGLIVEQYISILVDDRNAKEIIVKESLRNQSDTARIKALTAETELSVFRENHSGILVEQDSNVFQAKVLQIDAALNEAKLESNRINSIIDGLSSLDQDSDPSEIMQILQNPDNEYLSNILSLRAEALAQFAQAKITFTPNRSAYKEAEQRLTQIEQTIWDETNQQITALNTRKVIAGREVGRLQEQLTSLRKQFVEYKQSSAEFRGLKTQGDRHWNTFKSIEKSIMELDTDPETLPSFITTMSTAMANRDAWFPNKLMFIGVGGFLGVAASVLTIILLCVAGLPVTSTTQLSRLLPIQKALEVMITAPSKEGSYTQSLMESESFSDLVFSFQSCKSIYLSSFDKSDPSKAMPRAWAKLVANESKSKVLLVKIRRKIDTNEVVNRVSKNLYTFQVAVGDITSNDGRDTIQSVIEKENLDKVVFDGTEIGVNCVVSPWLDTTKQHVHLIAGIEREIKRRDLAQILEKADDNMVGLLIGTEPRKRVKKVPVNRRLPNRMMIEEHTSFSAR